MPYRFPRTFNEDYLRGLMKDARFANAYHPEHRAWHEQIAEGYKRLYPGPLKFDATGKMIRSAPATYTAPGTGGAVHVRAHLRHKNGKSVDVVDYWRSPPGKDGGDEGDRADPNDRPPTDTERPIRRPEGQPSDRGAVPMSDTGGSGSSGGSSEGGGESGSAGETPESGGNDPGGDLYAPVAPPGDASFEAWKDLASEWVRTADASLINPPPTSSEPPKSPKRIEASEEDRKWSEEQERREWEKRSTFGKLTDPIPASVQKIFEGVGDLLGVDRSPKEVKIILGGGRRG